MEDDTKNDESSEKLSPKKEKEDNENNQSKSKSPPDEDILVKEENSSDADECSPLKIKSPKATLKTPKPHNIVMKNKNNNGKN